MALLLASGSAAAQLRISGTVDGGVEYVSTGAPGQAGSVRVSSGSARPSRIVVEGTEAIGAQLSARFYLDAGFWSDIGSIYPTGPGSTGIFGRRSVVGLDSRRWGSLMLGREYTPQFWVGLKADVAGNAYYGNTVNRSHANSVRASNAVEYTSPSLGGWTVVALWSAGAVAGNNGNEAASAPLDEGRQRAASLDYQDERWLLAGAYGTTMVRDPFDATRTVATSDATVAAKYRAEGWTFNASWGHVRPVTIEQDYTVWMAGVLRPLSLRDQLGLQVSHSRQRHPGAADSTELVASMHLTRNLAPRTQIYANYARQRNSANSAAPMIAGIGPNQIVPPVAGTTLQVLLLGMSHHF
ncbi:MAG: porin [Pseudomonadota bacterium]